MQEAQKITVNSKKRSKLQLIPKYITVHSTANTATAYQEANNLSRPTNTSSKGFHIVVDDTIAITCIPLNEVAWHAGDGLNGTGNLRSIGIEICEGGDREKTLQNAIEIVSKCAKEFNIPIENIVQHNKWSGKNCPRILRDTNRWEWFISEVENKMYNELTKVNDLVYELLARNIITDKELWLKKLDEDKNTYWLARKLINYIRNKNI